MKRFSWTFVAVALGMVLHAYDDAEIKVSAKIWDATDTNVWQRAVPDFGPGSAVTFSGADSQYLYFGTNVTIGSLTVPNTVTPGSRAYYNIYPWRERWATSDDPTWAGMKWGERGYTLTMDSGSEAPAVIGAFAPLAGNIYRLGCHVPIKMASDLKLVHNGRTDWPGGSSGNGENVSLWMLGDISDDGGTHMLITEGPRYFTGKTWAHPVIALCGDNTFSGDVDIRAWTRLLNKRGIHDETSGTQLGRDNCVYVTNDCGVLDLSGNTYGVDHHLYIGGYTAFTSTVGKLTSMYGNPNATAVWKGPVTLVGDTAFGGAFSTYAILSMSSNMRIEGDIDDDGNNRNLQLVCPNRITLAGKNTFGGNLYHNTGFLTIEHPEGFSGGGKLVLASDAVYRMTAPNQPDLSMILYTNTVERHKIRLRLDGDFTYTPQSGFTNFTEFYKSGPGTLVWDKTNKGIGGNSNMDFFCLDGDTIFDYTQNDTLRLSGHTYFATIGAGNGGRVVLKTKNNQKNICDFAGVDWSTGEIVKEGAATYKAATPIKNAPYLLNFIVRDGMIIGEKSRQPILGASASMPNTYGESLIWSNRTWVSAVDPDVANPVWCGFDAYTNDWTRGKCFIDVTPELLETPIPPDFSVAALRFNTPPAGDTMTLTLSGTNDITGGCILITPEFGNDKTLRITGGAIGRPTAGTMRIVSYATNTVVILESDLVQTNRANAVNFCVYHCKVQFTGDSDYSGDVGIVGGELEVWDNSFMGGLASAGNINRGIHLNQGARLTTHGDFTLRRTVGSYYVIPYFRVYEKGGVLNVADGELATGESTGEIALYDNAAFTKTGKGHLNWNGGMARAGGTCMIGADKIHRYTFTDGKVTMNGNGFTNFRESQNLITVMSNVVITGDCAFNSNLGGVNGGGNAVDCGAKTAFYVGEGGVTFDVAGVARTVGNDGGDKAGFSGHPVGDFYVGSGDITFTNTSETAGSIVFKELGLSRLTGRMIQCAPKQNSGDCTPPFLLPQAEYVVPADLDTYVYQMMDGYQDLWIGRLTGEGAFRIYGRNNYMDPVAHIGRDADETFTFGGRLCAYSISENNNASARYMKIGTNRWRLTNPAGEVRSSTRVANGDVLIACEPSDGEAGALGFCDIYLGDTKTPPNGVPRVLTDGAYTITNHFRILASAPATACPALGGNAVTEASTFTGDIRLWHDIDLYSAGGTVTFTGAFLNGDGNPHAIAKRGPGKVIIQHALPAFSAVNIAEGILELTAPFAIPEGATLDFDTSVCTKENRHNIYTLLACPGGVSGRFEVIADIPFDWKVIYANDAIHLVWAKRGTLIQFH